MVAAVDGRPPPRKVRPALGGPGRTGRRRVRAAPLGPEPGRTGQLERGAAVARGQVDRTAARAHVADVSDEKGGRENPGRRTRRRKGIQDRTDDPSREELRNEGRRGVHGNLDEGAERRRWDARVPGFHARRRGWERGQPGHERKRFRREQLYLQVSPGEGRQGGGAPVRGDRGADDQDRPLRHPEHSPAGEAVVASKVTIRLASVEDAPVLCAAEVETARTPGRLVSHPHELKVELFASRIAEVQGKGRYIVAERDDRPVGHAVLEPMSLKR